MKLDLTKLKVGKSVLIKQEVVLESTKYRFLYPLISIKSINAEVEATKYNEFVEVSLKIDANVVLACSYTLEHFDYRLRDRMNQEFALFEEDQTEDTILIKGNTLDLDPYIFDMISMGIPSKPVKPGASKPKDGSNYRILTEDEYNKEKENTTDSRFDKLADLKFDEEDE